MTNNQHNEEKQKEKSFLELIEENTEFLDSDQFKNMNGSEKNEWFNHTFEKFLKGQKNNSSLVKNTLDRHIKKTNHRIEFSSRDNMIEFLNIIHSGKISSQSNKRKKEEILWAQSLLERTIDGWEETFKKSYLNQLEHFETVNKKILERLKNFFTVFKKKFGKTIIKNPNINITAFYANSFADDSGDYTGDSFIKLISGVEPDFGNKVTFIDQKLNSIISNHYFYSSSIKADIEFRLWLLDDKSNLLNYWLTQIKTFLKDYQASPSDELLEDALHFNFSYYDDYRI